MFADANFDKRESLVASRATLRCRHFDGVTEGELATLRRHKSNVLNPKLLKERCKKAAADGIY